MQNFRILSVVDFRLAAGRLGHRAAVMPSSDGQSAAAFRGYLEVVTGDSAIGRRSSARFRVLICFACGTYDPHGLPSFVAGVAPHTAAGDGFLQ